MCLPSPLKAPLWCRHQLNATVMGSIIWEMQQCQDWHWDGSPGVGHDLGDSDALHRIRGEEPLQEMLAGVAGAPRRLVLPRDDAGEQLLQALEVVAAVVAALCKGQHRCTGRGTRYYATPW